jgi:hypothetical protein
VQFLGFPPRPAVAVFPEMFDHQPHVFQMTDSSIGMSKPKAFRMLPHQRPRLLDQLRRRGRRGGKIMHGFRPVIHGSRLSVFQRNRKSGWQMTRKRRSPERMTVDDWSVVAELVIFYPPIFYEMTVFADGLARYFRLPKP